jgi:hypothetical protein
LIKSSTTPSFPYSYSIVYEYNSNIGINQPAPTSKLHVASALSASPVFQAEATGYLGAIGSIKHLFEDGSQKYGVYQAGTSLINYFQGKVGIGSENPSQALEVCHSDTNGGIVINQKDTSLKKSEIKFSVDGVEKWAVGNQINPQRPNSFFIWNNNLGRTDFFIGDNGMTGIHTEWPSADLDVNGTFESQSVGIGIDPPHPDSTYKLFVEGGIKARKVLVTINSFSDYVFEKDYRLMTIPELETYIKANGHMPGIPSAAEVERENGIEVGDFQTRLLARIEEQSLYIISLQKQIDELKSMISSIKNTK